jgi:acetate kinase
MDVLVVNRGSTSLKFVVFRSVYYPIVSGEYFFKDVVEFTYKDKEEEQSGFFANAQNVVDHMINIVEEYTPDLSKITVLHRILHGGGKYTKATKLSPKVITDLTSYTSLAPLHQPHALVLVSELMQYFPKSAHYGVFDTAFHKNLPESEYIYGLPYKLQKDLGIRRHGFHGISHEFVFDTIYAHTEKNDNIVSVHLGGGCSVCAIKNGKSIGISMGMTPEEGLIMATRSGDLSAGVIMKLVENGYTKESIETLVNEESGLKGLSDTDGDMQEILKNLKNPHNALAFEIYIERVAEEIAKSIVKLDGLDQLVFTGGVGFGSQMVRDKIIDKLGVFDLEVQDWVNLNNHIQHQASEKPAIWAIQTNEELQMYKIWQKLI